MRWRAPMQKSRAIKGAKDGRRAVHEWAVMSRLALGDQSMSVRELLDATRSDVDTLMDACVRGAHGVAMADP
jgi:hypothetical protein